MCIDMLNKINNSIMNLVNPLFKLFGFVIFMLITFCFFDMKILFCLLILALFLIELSDINYENIIRFFISIFPIFLILLIFLLFGLNFINIFRFILFFLYIYIICFTTDFVDFFLAVKKLFNPLSFFNNYISNWSLYFSIFFYILFIWNNNFYQVKNNRIDKSVFSIVTIYKKSFLKTCESLEKIINGMKIRHYNYSGSAILYKWGALSINDYSYLLFHICILSFSIIKVVIL